jgi:hypothetical protein
MSLLDDIVGETSEPTTVEVVTMHPDLSDGVTLNDARPFERRSPMPEASRRKNASAPGSAAETRCRRSRRPRNRSPGRPWRRLSVHFTE